MNIAEEIQRRRTFAIISHPDAGKTTLTEKLLLYGGAILEAGSVKGKKANKHAVSDWMEIEKSVESRFPARSCSFSMKDIASTFWIRRDTKTSVKIPIGH